MSEGKAGKVVLVGAGPGDPGLLTIKGQEMLEAADVVVYDRLVCDDILEYARDAKLVDVGKEQGHHPTPQHRINEILVREAQGNRLVVRLKGGDPYVFGRGGEEVEALGRAGVEFEVVPGVTSALAALSYAGISATSRGIARSVQVITGHAKENEPLDIDYDALCRAGGTLVFLMSVASTPTIVEGLLSAGMPADTACAFVENGTLPEQRRVGGTLADIVRRASEQGVRSPAILAVGAVCEDADTLDWFTKRALFGRTVVVTRPRASTGTLSKRLRDLGARVIPLPTIDTRMLESSAAKEALGRIESYSWLVLTSPQGARYLFELLDLCSLDVRSLAPVRIAAIGRGTAAELSLRGLRADYVPSQFDACHLGEGLAESAGEGERVLMLRAKQGSPALTRALAERDIPFDDIALYETVPLCGHDPDLDALLRDGKVDYVTFTSASTVEGFSRSFPEAKGYPFTGVCIGEMTQAAAQAQGYSTITAQNATIGYMIEALLGDVAQRQP